MTDRMTISRLAETFGRSARDRSGEGREPSIRGARAMLEAFYHAFNTRSLTALAAVWAPQELASLNNPLGGITFGSEKILSLYQRIFAGSARVWVEFSDIVVYGTPEMVTFAGRETGEFRLGERAVPLSIRTTRIFQYCGPEFGWRQIHHHGSIDDPDSLRSYQEAVLDDPRAP